MYQVSYFKNVSEPLSFAVTPDESGSILPAPKSWRLWFSQPVHPEQAIAGSDLAQMEVGYKKDGYYLFPQK